MALANPLRWPRLPLNALARLFMNILTVSRQPLSKPPNLIFCFSKHSFFTSYTWEPRRARLGASQGALGASQGAPGGVVGSLAGRACGPGWEPGRACLAASQGAPLLGDMHSYYVIVILLLFHYSYRCSVLSCHACQLRRSICLS